jgi:2-polyprenyl-3-methyl-5-hydroxy-6-metoxy-1,4-benzoquinol methylase
MNTYQHWSKLSRNPISPEVLGHVKTHLNRIHAGPHPGIDPFLDIYVRGKEVLDIGVVEHDLSFINRPSWKHGQLKAIASRIVGVDILDKEVQHLRDKGFDVRLYDATSDADLGERFDTVYIGDVIEHVNDPVRMLNFAARHVKSNGCIIVTTPCPFWWRNIILMIADNTYIGNVDHVSWVTPVNALELGSRAKLHLDHYYTLETYGNTLPKKLIKWLIEKFIGKNEIFTWAYAYIFKK